MKNIKNWFYNLTIRNKLNFAVLLIILNLLVLLLVSNFLYRTVNTVSPLTDIVKYHSINFQNGMINFYKYVNTNDEKYFNSAVEKIDNANVVLTPLAFIFKNKEGYAKDSLRNVFLNGFSPLYQSNKQRIAVIIKRISFFTKFNIPIVNKLVKDNYEGLQTSKVILDLIKRYKNSKDPLILEKISSKYAGLSLFYNRLSSDTAKFNSFLANFLLYFNTFIILIIIVISYFVLTKISYSISKPTDNLVKIFKEIELGNLNINIKPHSKDEIGMLIRSFNGIQKNLQGFLRHAQSIASGNYSARLTPRSEKDEISVALNKMAESLEKNDRKIKTDNWLRDGLAKINSILNSDLTPEKMGIRALSFLIEYTESLAGAIYFKDNDRMKLIAKYGLDEKLVPESIKKGEGLSGQVWENGKQKIIYNASGKGFKVFSSSGEFFSKTAVIIPLFASENEPVGILEIASQKDVNETFIELLHHVSTPLATALQISDSRQKIALLLQRTQQQAEELETQQEELRAANVELEEQTALLRENEKRLQEQQEELKVSNEELEERTHDLEMQRKEIMEKNAVLQKMQEELKRKAQELEQASRYKSEFLANMSHELRTPLNSMLILSKDLSNNKKGNLTPEQIESAKIIYNAGKDLLNLINDILDLSKIESGKMQINPEHTSLSDIVSGLKNIFEKMAQERGIYFKTEIDAGVPDNLFTDRQRLDQIIKNLVSNALKFTQEGGVTVKFRKNDNPGKVKGYEGESICVDVIDTGIGIPEDKQQAIFEAFQQADGSISRKFGGTGLGLSISKQLASKLGGTISLKSEYGKGSVFTVCIPVSVPGAQKSEIEKQSGEHPKPAAKTGNDDNTSVETKPVGDKNSGTVQEKTEPFVPDDRNNISGFDNTLLIIEDDPQFAKILLKECHKYNFKGIVSPTAEEGLMMAEKYKPDAITLDIKLPGMNGNKFLKILKENPSLRHIPVQILSGADTSELSNDKCVFGILNKPVTGEQLDDVMESIKKYINKEVKELLIVEDDVNTQKTLQKTLASPDIEFTVTSSGSEAFDLINTRNFDCVILDLGIRDISGFDLIKKLHNENVNNKKIPPVIVYTGRNLSKEETRELEKYVSTVIIKGEKSDERLLDETALFLHQVVDKMDDEKKKLIKDLHHDDSVFEGKKILLVDDDMRNVFALSHILSEQGFEVVQADNGITALKRLEEVNSVDLVLMDVMMPEMDGYTATQKIRENEKFKDLPVIILTAKAMKEDKEKAFKAGASDYLTKPVDVDKMLSLIRVWLYK